MNKLNIFICENFFPEFNRIVEKEKMDDVAMMAYPCMCENKAKKVETEALFQQSNDRGEDGLVICSQFCEAVRFIKEKSSFEIRRTNYCFNHLAHEGFIEYILKNGGYIIGLGWLRNWRAHISNAGFDQATARRFYQEFCKELVFFDAGIDPNTEVYLKDLSTYLEIPYVIIPFELESIEYMLKSIVSEWRLHKKSEKYKEPLLEAQAQCAEYSAIFDLMGKIAVHSNKRDTIEKVKEVFLHMFGAKQFKYWNNDTENKNISEDMIDFLEDENKEFILFKEENRFCIKISWDKKPYGILDVGEFIFPQYIDKYLNFAIEIGKICGLILSNNQQYEKILKSEKELQYLSYHDGLTGLYNRTYINSILSDQSQEVQLGVFMFDIDKLKYVNDHYGHLEGDKIILNAAKLLKKCFREEDVLARIGGDEFVAIVTESAPVKDNLKHIHKRICKEIELYNQSTQEAHLKIGISIGYVHQDHQNESIESLIKKADQNMYLDKKCKHV